MSIATCWFFKQLCPLQKKNKLEIRTSYSPSVLSGGVQGGLGRAGKWGWAGSGARAIRLCFSVSLSLSLTPPPISVFSQVFYFLVLVYFCLLYVYCLSSPLYQFPSSFASFSPYVTISLSVSHTLHDMWWRGSLVQKRPES